MYFIRINFINVNSTGNKTVQGKVATTRKEDGHR